MDYRALFDLECEECGSTDVDNVDSTERDGQLEITFDCMECGHPNSEKFSVSEK